MVSRTPKIIWIASSVLLLGIALIGIPGWFQARGKYPDGSLAHILLEFFSDLGMALAVGSIVALILDWSISKQHLDKISRLLGHHHDIEEAGFRSIYPDRQKVFDDLFKNVLPKVKHELKIVGICVSLFREADRPGRIDEWDEERAIKSIVEIIKRNCNIKVLFLKRYPTPDELKQYGILQGGDFFYMRERDEDFDYNFHRGNRLKIIANRSLGCWIRVLIDLAKQTQNDDKEKRKGMLSRLQIREYISLPSVSLYIADEEIYVTPYLCKRHCSTVPAFQVAGKDTSLFKAYNAHFEYTWTDQDFTKPAINEKFIQLLIDEPRDTLEIYMKKHKEIFMTEKAKVRATPNYLEDPENYRVEEKTIEATLNEKKVSPEPIRIETT